MKKIGVIFGAWGALILSLPLLIAQESQPAGSLPPPLALTPGLPRPAVVPQGAPLMTPTITPPPAPPAKTATAPSATAPSPAPTTPPAAPDQMMMMPAPAPAPDAAAMPTDMPAMATIPVIPVPDAAPPAQPEASSIPPAPPIPTPQIPTTPPPAPESAPAPEKKAMLMPEFAGIAGWLNSQPLTKDSLKGKVVLVDFWTYSCVNCLRTVPYLKEWYKKYKDRGFVLIGVHSPEFEFEKDPANVQAAVTKLGITYPIALDSQMATWAAYANNVWPAHYFIDAEGKVRHIHLGEGEYEESEKMIQKLLMERDQPKAPESQPATEPSTQPSTMPAETAPAAPETAPVPHGRKGRRARAAAPQTQPAAPASETKPAASKPLPLPALSKYPPNVDFSQIKSPETYLGLIRRERLVTSGRPIEMNEWMYDGKWRTEGDRIVLSEGTGKIAFRFNATKVNLVMAPTAGGVQAVVKIDGQPVPADKAGADVKNGTVMITEPRMYELLNLGAQGSEHIIEIEFLNPGAAAYAFTFG